MGTYEVGLLVVGMAVFGAVVLPRVLSDKPLSLPILYVGAGALGFTVPLGVEVPDPVEHAELADRLTELVVIIALTGAGLKLDRPFDLSAWSSTWRLLGIAMPLTIAVTAVLGWGALGLGAAAAVLLGAVIAPTDPVLASDVEAGPSLAELEEDLDPERQVGDVRFALTSEAGLNDGLAFPFTNLALAMAAVTIQTAWTLDASHLEVRTNRTSRIGANRGGPYRAVPRRLVGDSATTIRRASRNVNGDGAARPADIGGPPGPWFERSAGVAVRAEAWECAVGSRGVREHVHSRRRRPTRMVAFRPVSNAPRSAITRSLTDRKVGSTGGATAEETGYGRPTTVTGRERLWIAPRPIAGRDC